MQVNQMETSLRSFSYQLSRQDELFPVGSTFLCPTEMLVVSLSDRTKTGEPGTLWG